MVILYFRMVNGSACFDGKIRYLQAGFTAFDLDGPGFAQINAHTLAIL